jgi:hypothetical protein
MFRSLASSKRLSFSSIGATNFISASFLAFFPFWYISGTDIGLHKQFIQKIIAKSNVCIYQDQGRRELAPMAQVENYILQMYAGGTMDDTKKMLQTIINGQSAMKAELLGKIDKLGSKVDLNHENLSKKITEVEDRLTKRIDIVGLQVAGLEDDTLFRVRTCETQ